MSEKAEASTGEATDPFAAALALSGASREKADAFLDDQRHHIHEQLKQIHLDIFEKWLGVLLRLATLCVGIGAAFAAGLMIWQAAHSNGLVIEPFSVPPDMAQRGMTGQVVATKLLDRLVAMQAQTNSARPAKSYANAWGEHGIKLEIPETGVSLTELNKWLRDWLGNDSRISGEVVRTDKGLTLTARTDDGAAPGVSDAEEDMDGLADRLAEQIYAISQPFRFGMYLVGKGRNEEALVVFRRLAMTGDRDDRMWAYPRWGLAVATLYGVEVGLPILERSIALEPGTMGAYDQIGLIRADKGQWEQSLQTFRTQLNTLKGSRQTYVAPADVPMRIRMAEGLIAIGLGAYRESLPVWEEMSRKPFAGFGVAYGPTLRVRAHVFEHDRTAARAAQQEAHNVDPANPFALMGLNLAVESSRDRQDWPAALAATTRLSAYAQRTLRGRSTAATSITPRLAEALAHLGRFAEAERAIAPTPADCYPCLMTRAGIAELRGQRARADFWFTRAAAIGPSLPFAHHEWGRALLVRGQPDAAIEQFAIANRKSPHFADALEYWGEALMAKSQSYKALAKFAEAEKYAPNWGRLHLKWGEALEYAGKRDEARAHFTRAAKLDLNPAEKAALARRR